MEQLNLIKQIIHVYISLATAMEAEGVEAGKRGCGEDDELARVGV